jgi:dGTPase
MEVSQIARTIAMALRLNEGLVEAIALGHDLGHTPFGHLGERDLNKVVPGGFHHNEQSVRVVEHLEKQGEGLNLTIEVLDGILNHRGEGTPKTLEGKVVQIADKIAYVNHDIDDAIRSNMIKEDDLPKDCTDLLGKSPAKRIDFLIRDIIKQSASTNDVRLSQEARDALYRLRQYLFDNVYSAGPLSWERTEYGNLLSAMYLYYLDNFDALPNEFIQIYKTDSVDKIKKRIVTDYLAGMTDRYAKHTYDTLKEKMN